MSLGLIAKHRGLEHADQGLCCHHGWRVWSMCLQNAGLCLTLTQPLPGMWCMGRFPVAFLLSAAGGWNYSSDAESKRHMGSGKEHTRSSLPISKELTQQENWGRCLSMWLTHQGPPARPEALEVTLLFLQPWFW